MEKSTEIAIANAISDVANTLQRIEEILREINENGVVVCQYIDEDENGDAKGELRNEN